MKIRCRIAAISGSTPLTRYFTATSLRRILSSWTSAALPPVRPGKPANTLTARGASPRAGILAKAGELIAGRGVDASTVDGICRANKTSNSPFYRRFSGKEDLVPSVLDDRAQALLSDQRQQLAEVTTMAGLEKWRDNLVADNRQRGGFGCVFGTMFSQLADRDEHARIQLAGYLAEWHRMVATTLRRMQTGGQLRRDADPDELATGLIGALQGGYVLAQASRNVDHMATAIEMALARVRFFADDC
jgi:TetR/AcrR family transcriptional regulator, transcriptional repressor for nem operon